MKLRYAFDVGTNSLGWAVYQITPAGEITALVDAGVRIYSDGRNPKDGQSLAVMRRGPRAARRRRDRYLQRRKYLMDLLIQSGLMPSDAAARKALETEDPYALRKRGLYEALTPHEFGRVIFHLNQRRGFQSNRIADGDDDENGKIKKASAKLIETLNEQGCQTLGEFLANRQTGPVRERQAVRVRLQGQGAKALYDFYPTRDLLKAEFEILWERQAPHHSGILTAALREKLFDCLFFQRPLKPPAIGKCTFYPEETRLAKAHPLSQARRIYQDLNHLRLREGLSPERSLTLEERDALAAVLFTGEDVTFTKFRKLTGLSANVQISLEEAKTEKLIGDQIAFRLGGKKGALHRIWPQLTPDQRTEIALRLVAEADEIALIDWLQQTFGVSEAEARKTAATRLPEGHDRLGLTATAKIVDALKKAVIQYSTACADAGFHHSDERDGEIFDELPPYPQVLERHTVGGTGDPKDPDSKRYGRVPNPTVHVGLNQLRRVANAMVGTYGPPDQIVLEFARDLKLSKAEKDKEQATNKDNEAKNKARAAELEAMHYEANGRNLRLMRLWEELGPPLSRSCVYTGKPISLSALLGPEIEIEHILPFSKTLDDSMSNKTVAYREANRGKRDQSPAQAFSGAEYDAIRERAQALPPNKRWRFDPDAMTRYEDKERGFLARQLGDTRHLAKMAKAYVGKLTEDPASKVWVVTGQLTALLRGKFGLNGLLGDGNRKNRTDHRHHAIDAIVIGATDRSLLQKIAHKAGEQEHADFGNVLKDLPDPFPGFRDQVRSVVENIIVSHKAEHGTGGALHDDTNYGIVTGDDKLEGDLVTRKAIEALTPGEIDKVRDRPLRAALQAIKQEAGGNAKLLATKLAEYRDANGVRRVRILKKQEDFIPIKDRRTGEAYRAVIAGENHHMDIVEGPDGVWRGFAATVFEVNQDPFVPKWRTEMPGAKLVMRLHKGDLVEVADDDGVRRIKRVVRLSPSNNIIYLVRHNDAGDFQKRHVDQDDLFRWDFANISKLRSRKCTITNINELGKLPRHKTIDKG